MMNERSKKSDRYHPSFFSLFRPTAMRSKSLESVYDRNRRKRGKRKVLYHYSKYNFNPVCVYKDKKKEEEEEK
jgi:hypothetical protein